MRVVVLSEEVGGRWQHYPTFFSLCGRDIIIIPGVRYVVFYCPLVVTESFHVVHRSS